MTHGLLNSDARSRAPTHAGYGRSSYGNQDGQHEYDMEGRGDDGAESHECRRDFLPLLPHFQHAAKDRRT